jgi:hypothetical protein
MSRSLTLPKARRSKDTSGSADASGLQEKQPDLDARTDSETESENVMARAREYIAASQKSLRQGTELVRQCREIVRQAKSAEPITHDAKLSPMLTRPPLRAPKQKPTKKRARSR